VIKEQRDLREETDTSHCETLMEKGKTSRYLEFMNNEESQGIKGQNVVSRSGTIKEQ